MTESLDAGRALDVAIAVRVFGWVQRTTESNTEQLVTVPPEWTDFSPFRWLGHDINELVPAYSTEIAAAWTVVEKLTGRSMNRQARMSLVNDWFSQEWTCAFFGTGNPLLGGSGGHKAATAPLAICRAALAAAGAEDPPMQRLPIGEPGQFLR